MKPTNAYKHCITNTVSLVYAHVSATLVAILVEMSYKKTYYNNFKNQYTNAEWFKIYIQM
jgi:hypothetical protein